MARDEGTRLIEAYRRVTVPDAETEAAILARLEADVLEEEEEEEEQEEVRRRSRPVPGGSGRRVALALGIAVALAAIVLLAFAGILRLVVGDRHARGPDQATHQTELGSRGGVTVPRATRPRERPAGEALEVAPMSEAIEPPTPNDGSAPLSAAKSAQEKPGSAARQSRNSTRSEALPSTETVTEEARLLARAQAALRDGDPKAALAWLGKHAERFATGTMALERQALRAIALCEAGRASEGKEVGQSVVKDAAAAPYAARIRKACGI